MQLLGLPWCGLNIGGTHGSTYCGEEPKACTPSTPSDPYALPAVHVSVAVVILWFVTCMVFGLLPQVFTLHGELQK